MVVFKTWILQIRAGLGGNGSKDGRIPNYICLAKTFGNSIRKELELPNSCLPPK